VDFTTHPFLNVIASLFLLFIWVAWIFIWIRIVADVLRRRDIGGWYKAIWIVILIFIPLISALVYIVTYNDEMTERAA
jgi:predicted PurR-regulated permease PerM